jgi:hypothetical protein
VDQISDEDRLGTPTDTGPNAGVDRVLWAKYLDYCSARISEVFLSLTDEHTYDLMEQAAREASVESESLGFQAMMTLVTRKLQRSVPLPDFDSWSREYEQHPEKYDPYLLGLWQTAEGDGTARGDETAEGDETARGDETAEQENET